MAKKNKEKWQCGDCGAWNTYKDDSCAAGERHELGEKLFTAEYQIAMLKEENAQLKHGAKYMSSAEFVETLSEQIQAYLDKMYGKNAQDLHREDLMSTTMSFMEALWIIHQIHD